MRALTVVPKQQGSLRVDTVPDPQPAQGELLVRGLALGVCGTDKEIAPRRIRLGATRAGNAWCWDTSHSVG